MAEPVKAGDRVIDFRLRGVDGRVYDSAEARRKGMLLYVFWKKSCSTCQYTIPFIQRFHDQYAHDRCQVWGISQDNEADTLALVDQFGATFPQLLDEDLAVSMQYRLTNVPDIYLVDETDTILRSAPAFVADELNAMARLVAERTGVPYSPIVLPEDNAPASKPG